MATVQLKDNRTYGKAIGLLLEMGGLFQTRHPRKLLIGPGQIHALLKAGLLASVNGAPKRGQKKS